MVKPKTESTAVNELINLVATRGPSVPAEDLLFREPEPKPMSRKRAPVGTQPNPTSAPTPNLVASTMLGSGPQHLSSPPAAPSNMVTSTLRGSTPAIPTRPSLPPPTPSRVSISMPAVTPPPLPRASMSMAAVTPPPVPSSRASIAVPPVPPVPPSRASIALPVAEPAPQMPTPPTMPDPLEARAADQAKVDMTDQSWFMDTRTAARVQPPAGENWIGTTAVSRQANLRGLVGKLVLPAILAAVAGVLVGGYLVLDGKRAKTRAADADSVAPIKLVHSAAGPAGTDEPATPAVATAAKPVEPSSAPAAVPAATATEPTAPASAEQPSLVAAAPGAAEPAALPVTPPNMATAPAMPSMVPPNIAKADPAPAPVAPAVGAKTFVDIRIDSKPSGATVTLVDRGKSIFLGTTPIVTSVDPSRTYDVMFEHHDRTQLEHLDPRATSRLDIALATDKASREETRAARNEKPAKAEKKAVKVEAPKVETPKVAKAAKVEVPKTVKAEKAVAAPAVASPAGDGLLMISSKPPCELFIDGKATGLMTPQRGIPLSAGKHKITLVSPDKKIRKSVAVDIVADKPTKVIQDLMGE